MEELIRAILQSLNAEATDAQIEEAAGSTDLAELARSLSIDTEDVDEALNYTPDIPKMEVREGEPYIATTSQISRNSPNNRTIVAINTDTKDRHGTIIDPEGGLLENYRNNPVFLINHSYALPAGNGANVRMQDGRLIAEVSDANWNSDDSTEKGREIMFWHNLVKEGKIRMASVGIMPLEIERVERELEGGETENVVVIRKWELLEFSFIPVGSNPGALVLQRELSLKEDSIKNLEQRIIELEAKIGQTKSPPESPEERSKEKTPGASGVDYVKPRIKYVPPELSAKRVAEKAQQIIKQKQGKA